MPSYSKLLLALVVVVSGAAAATAQDLASDVSGRVVSSRDNEPLALVQVELLDTSFVTVTGNDGAFRFVGVPPGNYVLRTTIVGYAPIRQDFVLAAGEPKRFDVVLNSSTVRATDTAVVTADTFDLAPVTSAAEFTIAGEERKNLASVLADDPLRAVQSLPGVTANDDFSSEFSVRGAPFSRVGLYLDGVLIHSPFHSTDGQAEDGSLTVFSGDLTDDMTLYQGAWPVRYSDRTAGILAVDTRPGTRDDVRGEVTASASNGGFVAEGPWTKQRHGSWLVGVRKSYLQYILNRIDFGDQAPLAFGFTDAQARLDYDVSPTNALSLTWLNGTSAVDRTRFRTKLSPTTIMTSGFDFSLVNVGSRYASQRLLVITRLAWSHERGDVANRDHDPLLNQTYTDWTTRSDGTLMLKRGNSLDFGGQFRHIRQDGQATEVVYAPDVTTVSDVFHGVEHQTGAYVQESAVWARARFAGGARLDRYSLRDTTIATPYATVSFGPTSRTRVQFDWGQYAQLPELNQFFSIFGGERLLPERSTHLEASLEQRIDSRTRVRLEFYDRQDRDLLARPALVPRLGSDGHVIQASPVAPWLNSERGYSRGIQAFLQRRTANGFTGWLSYAYGHARVTDGTLHLAFPTDYDQRHTFNVYLSRRLRPTVNLSGRFTYGSGMPLPGFYRSVADGYQLDGNRNRVTAPAYERTDVRLNKAYTHRKLNTTLYAEVINVTNHGNSDFDSPGPYDPNTGRVHPNFYSMFPILPSAGLVVAF